MASTNTDYISRVASPILRAVVKIRSNPGGWQLSQTLGTGFLLSITGESATERHLFLVTNKHVISDWTLADGTIQNYSPTLDITLYGGPGGAFTPITVPLTDGSGQPIERRLLVSSDDTVDVALVYLNEIPVPIGPSLSYNSFDLSFFLRFENIQPHLTGLGDQVYALGYPMGITSLTTSYPIAKSGYIASIPGQLFSIDIPDKSRSGVNVTKRLDGRILVVDGLIVPGNSGGPVVTPHEIKIRRDPATNQLQFVERQLENWVVGIVSRGLGPTGLTLVYSSDYILDLAEAFVRLL